MPLQAIAVPPSDGQPPTGLIIALHGWGANAQDLASLSPYMNFPGYQLVFPNAPFPHPYNPIGVMWYGFPANYQFQNGADFGHHDDLAKSRQLLTEFIHAQTEKLGIPLSRTILAGFSQGGAMTLDVGLSLPLAGLMVLSGYLHAPVPPDIALPPVLVVHGRQDAVVPVESARYTRDTLIARGADVTYQEFEMGHDIQPGVLVQMQQFVTGLRDRTLKNQA